MEIQTLSDLKNYLNKLSESELNQPIQAVIPSVTDEISECLCGIAIDTVDNFGFATCRSTHNNKFCPQDIVILLDYNPFGEDGATSYTFNEDFSETPNYDMGKTDLKEQINPKFDPSLDEYSGCLIAILKHRMRQ